LADKHQYNRVGYQVTDAIPHVYRMYSLKKCFDLDDAPLAVDECIKTPKLDGAAVSLLYVEGFLQLALTRGDGIQGKDITDKMKELVPNQISTTAMVQITGEVVAPNSIPIIGGEIMDNAWRMINTLVSELTSVVIGLAGLGIVAAIVFGGPVFGLDVIGGVTELVEMLSSNGVAGLLVLAILYSLVAK
jgi:hypothetical protein